MQLEYDAAMKEEERQGGSVRRRLEGKTELRLGRENIVLAWAWGPVCLYLRLRMHHGGAVKAPS